MNKICKIRRVFKLLIPFNDTGKHDAVEKVSLINIKTHFSFMQTHEFTYWNSDNFNKHLRSLVVLLAFCIFYSTSLVRLIFPLLWTLITFSIECFQTLCTICDHAIILNSFISFDAYKPNGEKCLDRKMQLPRMSATWNASIMNASKNVCHFSTSFCMHIFDGGCIKLQIININKFYLYNVIRVECN